jgi:hypothetical protein
MLSHERSKCIVRYSVELGMELATGNVGMLLVISMLLFPGSFVSSIINHELSVRSKCCSSLIGWSRWIA